MGGKHGGNVPTELVSEVDSTTSPSFDMEEQGAE